MELRDFTDYYAHLLLLLSPSSSSFLFLLLEHLLMYYTPSSPYTMTVHPFAPSHRGIPYPQVSPHMTPSPSTDLLTT